MVASIFLRPLDEEALPLGEFGDKQAGRWIEAGSLANGGNGLASSIEVEAVDIGDELDECIKLLGFDHCVRAAETGNIIAAGYGITDGRVDVALMRLNANGSGCQFGTDSSAKRVTRVGSDMLSDMR